jgi:HlyD family secretion protein
MDRIIPKKKWTLKRMLLISGIVLAISVVLYQALFADRRAQLHIDRSRISVAEVKQGAFSEYIPRTGIVQPKRSYYLDAVEGGIISRLYKEPGAFVQAGEPILSLANSNLQLDVANREAQLFEQLNNLRNSRMALEQNSLRLRADLAEIDYQLQVLKPQVQRNEALFAEKLIAKQEYDELKEKLNWNLQRRRLTYASYRQDSILRAAQLNQLHASEARIMKNLEMIGTILENLEVKAPAYGQLSMPELELGQAISTGQRLGQVDVLDSFKIRVSVDELYLNRIDVGQEASFIYNNADHAARIAKIYPTISQGMFELDMDFVGELPEGIRSGQSVRLRLQLGSEEDALLLPAGAFYQYTGGNWIFVLETGGGKAVRRDIKLGRKNAAYYEVLEGLQPGDRVITSGYEYFGDNEVLVL